MTTNTQKTRRNSEALAVARNAVEQDVVGRSSTFTVADIATTTGLGAGEVRYALKQLQKNLDITPVGTKAQGRGRPSVVYQKVQ